MFKHKVMATLLFVLFSACSFAEVYKVSNELSGEEQTKLAKSLYEEMERLEDDAVSEIADLHKQVIEKCPTTLEAQESCWKLSNLFIFAYKNHQSAIDVLEHLVKQYPETELMPLAKNRLMSCYEKTENYEKLCGLYEEAFTENPNLFDYVDDADCISISYGYGKALHGVGKIEEAKKWFQKVLEKDNGKNSFEARLAKDYLEN